MRVMIDSNILDRLDEDTEALQELTNRRDILLLVTPAQEREVAAIPDQSKRERLLGIMTQACRRVALKPRILPTKTATVAMASSATQAGCREPYELVDDGIIAAAVAAGCELLVSEDIDVLNKSLAAGIRAMDWNLFLGRVVWLPRKKPKKS